MSCPWAWQPLSAACAPKTHCQTAACPRRHRRAGRGRAPRACGSQDEAPHRLGRGPMAGTRTRPAAGGRSELGLVELRCHGTTRPGACGGINFLGARHPLERRRAVALEHPALRRHSGGKLGAGRGARSRERGPSLRRRGWPRMMRGVQFSNIRPRRPKLVELEPNSVAPSCGIPGPEGGERRVNFCSLSNQRDPCSPTLEQFRLDSVGTRATRGQHRTQRCPNSSIPVRSSGPVFTQLRQASAKTPELVETVPSLNRFHPLFSGRCRPSLRRVWPQLASI